MTQAKPTLFIVDNAIDVTGALISAAQQAELSKDLVDTILVLPTSHITPSQLSASFSETIYLPIASLRKSIASVLLYVPLLVVSGIQLNRAMKQKQCTRLQLNDFSLMHGAIVRLLGFRGRIVTWVRIDPKRYGVVGRIWLALARLCSDELVVVSKFIARQLPPNYRSTLIYSGISPIADVPRSTGQQLLFVGNYIEGKGQDDAIRAFKLIAAQFPEAELVFHGSDMGLVKNRVYRTSLYQLAQDSGAQERIHLRNFSDDPGSLYSKAFAALNFSHSESFSLTCLEASAHGLPVIATRCGGPEEIVENGVSGFLVAVGDVEAMAERMAYLLTDSERARAMGDTGRLLVNTRFSEFRLRQKIRELII